MFVGVDIVFFFSLSSQSSDWFIEH